MCWSLSRELQLLLGSAAATSDYFLRQRVISAENYQLPLRWLGRCRSSHPRCPSAQAGKEPVLLARVVDVSRIAQGGEPVLLETRDLRGQYIALSHRWGGARITTTTVANSQDGDSAG